VDPAQRKRIHDDLKGVVRGELLFDELTRILYSTDASLFEVMPAGVVVPRDEEDVQALVRFAGENALPLVPRGAGTGLAGESLGGGIVVDFSVHFRAILDVGSDTIRVQPGVTRREVQDALARIGRRFAPDPVSEECTVGGMLARNASGARAGRLGTTRDHVQSLRAVLDSGDVATVGRVPRWPSPAAPDERLQDVVSSTVTLLEQNAALIQASRPRVALDRCGYALHDVLTPGELDLARLLVGSEGTLALFTEATLRTVPLPGGRSMVLFGFARLDAALRAARLALPSGSLSPVQGTASGPTTCDILDRRLLRLARNDARLADLVPEQAEAVLLVEYEADSPAEAGRLAQDLVERLALHQRLALLARVARDEAECRRFWQMRDTGFPGLHALRVAAGPLLIVEDVALPTEQLPAYLPRVQDVLRRQETTASFLINAGTGQVHMRPFLDLQDARDTSKLWTLADEVYSLVLEMGGTISAQHGTGLARMPWVGRQHGALAPVLRELKAIFDPRYLFNPGKVVAPPSEPIVWPLRRRGKAASPQDGPLRLRDYEPHLSWPQGHPALEALACNGCGDCRLRSLAPGQSGDATPPRRMCPIFRATSAEAATPRAKANLMRALLQPDADPTLLPSDQVREVAELCVNCKMCASECPSQVQIPRLMLEARAANVARHGLDRGDWVLARTESFAWLGSALAPVVNALARNPVARWVLEKVLGVSRRRRLPTFAADSFLRRARQRGWTRKPRSARPRVAYFVDVFANYNDPSIAEAVVAVLHHNGIEVHVPPGQVGCGMAPLAYGDVDTAREMVQHNLHLLADLAREGFPILCSEPTAALMLRHDALTLFDDADAHVVAGQVVELTAYLWDLHQQGLLRTDFKPLQATIGHHVPCHLKALGRPPAGAALLGLIPGVRARTIDVSCSGMAGTFGFKSDRYAVSLEAGSPMLAELSRPGYLFGATECSACRLQMEDGTGKRTLHPAQYLALAYDLMPEMADRLRQPVGRWVLS
jgi:FAD/FMN-containing dehydrogenase/Fe-S oxidoreductase